MRRRRIGLLALILVGCATTAGVLVQSIAGRRAVFHTNRRGLWTWQIASTLDGAGNRVMCDESRNALLVSVWRGTLFWRISGNAAAISSDGRSWFTVPDARNGLIVIRRDGTVRHYSLVDGVAAQVAVLLRKKGDVRSVVTSSFTGQDRADVSRDTDVLESGGAALTTTSCVAKD